MNTRLGDWVTGGLGVVCCVALLSACGGHSEEPAPGARVDFKSGDGDARGTAVLIEQNDRILIRTSARDLPPGLHGFHIHTTGKCEGSGFESAGGHFNPSARKHGTLNPEGPHAGDLPNLTASSNAPMILETVVQGVTLASLFDDDGSALVIHANQDDYKTDPSGSSGARIACGVIRRP